MVWHGSWFGTFGDAEASPIRRWRHELSFARGGGESFPEVVVVGQHNIKLKLFSFSEYPAITGFGVIRLKLRGTALNSGKVTNGIIEE